MALGFSWYALWIAGKPSNRSMTFGYHRVGILAALVNAVSLVVVALLILWEGIDRLRHPAAAHGNIMIATAALAIVVNIAISVWLHAGAKHDLNLRGAYLHMVGDAVSALGVVIAGLIIAFTGQSLADPIVSFLIAGLILWSSWGVLKESLNVLLEGTPRGMDMAEVEATIKSVGGVLDAHDLHVWTIGPGAIAASVHILVDEQSIRDGQQILGAVVRALASDHKITHTTVQVEVQGHDSNEMYCTINRNEPDHIGHGHQWPKTS
jgi:cobalt-zinc-cadmium efflux system protein